MVEPAACAAERPLARICSRDNPYRRTRTLRRSFTSTICTSTHVGPGSIIESPEMRRTGLAGAGDGAAREELAAARGPLRAPGARAPRSGVRSCIRGDDLIQEPSRPFSTVLLRHGLGLIHE